MEELLRGCFFLIGNLNAKAVAKPKRTSQGRARVRVHRRIRAAEHISPVSTFKTGSELSFAARLTGDNLPVCSASHRRRTELIDPAVGVIFPDMTSVWSGFQQQPELPPPPPPRPSPRPHRPRLKVNLSSE